MNYEAHYDHIVTGRACAQAAISCSLKSYPEETTTSQWQLSGVGFYFTSAANVIEDITEFFDLKFEAIALHKTQVDEYTLQLYRTYFTMRGQQLTQSDRIGEGLKMLRPIHLHCLPEAENL